MSLHVKTEVNETNGLNGLKGGGQRTGRQILPGGLGHACRVEERV